MRKFFMVWNFKKKFQPLKIALKLSRSDFLVVLIFCFLFRSLVSAAGAGENEGEIRALLAEAYISDGDYESAIEEYREVLKNDPGNIEARAAFADILSWNKKYNEALELYDEILKDNEAPEIRLQKARVLGWAREYDKSLKEYQRILDNNYSEAVEVEMRAKRAYWNNRVQRAIKYYKELIEKDPKNVEAMFDLSQVYSYQSMWEDAVEEYNRILAVYPGHFKAKEGLDKTGLISKHVLFKSGYEFFEADSPSRDNDIRKHSLFAKVSVPFRNNLRVDGDYYLTFRNFRDFNDVIENQGRVNVEYRNNPDWWLGGFYKIFVYDKNIKAMHNFGGNFSFRILDSGVSFFSYERERLENNSTVIREHYHADAFKERVDIDINKKLKVGLDYIFSHYSDDNYKNEPGFDVMYYFSLEPMMASVKYRYFFREFKDKVSEYFSPKGFSTNSIAFNWRHYLNKEEVFFGANDLYYDVKYEMTVDSEYIVGHKFAGEINWDINKRLNFNVKGSIVNSSANVYKDKSLTASIKYYF